MSNITQCPHCKTRFRIQPEQLEARRGLVCCGRCQHVFNARSNLIDLDGEAVTVPTPAPETPKQFPPGEEIDVPIEPSTSVSEATSDAASAAESPAIPVPETTPPATADLVQIAPEPEATTGGNEALTVEPLVEEKTTEAMDVEPFIQTVGSRAEVVSIPDEFLESTSIVRREWPIISAVTILALLLLAQLVHAFRVELAARLPGVRPALEAYCHALKCEIPLPQQAELLSLESSGLEASPEGDKWVVLTAVVRNRANYVQACPELLLTLTDQNDAVLVRKTFRPIEYLPVERRKEGKLGPGEDLDIRLELELQDVKPVGYKLLLYYPGAT